MKTLLLLALALAPLLRADPPEGDKYSLDELEAMGDRGEWNELVLRLDDVIPAQRNARWKALVERAADRYLQSLIASGQLADAVADSLRQRYPQLAASKTFVRRRGEAKMKALEVCYAGKPADSDCRGRLLEFANENCQDADWLKRAAENVTRWRSPAEAVRYYRILIQNDRKGAGWCEEAPVRRALLAALAEKEVADRQPAHDLALGLCWHALRSDIGKAAAEAGGAWQAVACEISRAKKQLVPRCPASN